MKFSTLRRKSKNCLITLKSIEILLEQSRSNTQKEGKTEDDHEEKEEIPKVQTRYIERGRLIEPNKTRIVSCHLFY